MVRIGLLISRRGVLRNLQDSGPLSSCGDWILVGDMLVWLDIRSSDQIIPAVLEITPVRENGCSTDDTASDLKLCKQESTWDRPMRLR